MDFMLDERYALIEQLVMNCMFYAAIFPIGIIITILGMVVAYWSSKWWILKYCSLPKFSYKLGRHVVLRFTDIEHIVLLLPYDLCVRVRCQPVHGAQGGRVRPILFHLHGGIDLPYHLVIHPVRVAYCHLLYS